MKDIALYQFGYHDGKWLEDIEKVAKKEPWGKDHKILELYLRANFEIAKLQGKVYEDKTEGLAFWKAGSLVNMTSDPIWLEYKRNTKGTSYWYFDKIITGIPPKGSVDDYSFIYNPPKFNRSWSIHFNQYNINHILGDDANKKRLENVFKSIFKSYSEYIAFRVIYAEIELKRKEESVIPQWYMNDYQFLMPLYLTQGNKVEMTAVLSQDPTNKRYIVKTLLLPNYAYAYARAIVKSRTMFADWIQISDADLETTEIIDE